MQDKRSPRWNAFAAIAAFSVLAAVAVPAAEAPAGQTYFMVLTGLEGAHDLTAGCIRFTPREMCFGGAFCGTWTPTEKDGPETGFAFRVEYEAAGLMMRMDGQARLENRGARSAIAGVARMGYAGANQNVSFAGRATSPQRCLRLATDFAHMSVGWAEAFCRARAVFDEPAASSYVLPYRVGEAYVVNQSYCAVGLNASHHAKFSYDFDMSVGTPILASRGGVVWMGYDGYLDGDRVDTHENMLWIEHDDGSVAGYGHLKHASILVEPGEAVSAGQRIATSGDTGSYPHLHFAVYRGKKLFDDYSLPVSFQNAGGPLDERGGLAEGTSYEALP